MTDEVKNIYEFADFRFDGRTNRLRRNDDIILLSPKASELLCLLLERQGEFVPKEEIFEKVWTDTFVEDGVLTQNIYTLRKALGIDENGQPLIENRTRLGYRITVPVRALEVPDDGFKTKTADRREILLATQTRTEITEEITEEDGAATIAARKGKSLKIGVGIAVGAILLSAAALAYFFFSRSAPERFENLRFQKVTDSGDIFIPAALSPDGNFVVFRQTEDFYLKDLRTSAVTKLEIRNVEKLAQMQFSADSNFIYFRNRGSYFLPANILKVFRDGGEATLVAENVWSAFSLSPDGKQLAFMRRSPEQNRQAIIIKNLENGEEREVFTVYAPQQIGWLTYPAWSPDSKKILSNIRKGNEEFQKLVITEIENGRSEDLVLEKFQDTNQFVWRPGKNALIGLARAGKTTQIFEVGLPDKKIRRITNDLNNYFSLTASADGKKILTMQRIQFTNIWTAEEENEDNLKQLTFGTSNLTGFHGVDLFGNGEIVYTSNESENGDINLWRINPADGARRQLTENAGNQNRNPSVSPDDKFIYFSSNRGGKSHIWRIGPNGENPTQITDSENSGETFPQISPDGEYLYFIRKERQSSAVWRKSLTAGAEERLTDPDRLSPASFLALSPDGKRLAFQHLTEQIDSDDSAQQFQVAVIEIVAPENVKFFSTGGSKVQVYWTKDSAAFDFSNRGNEKNTTIVRVPLDENVKRSVVKRLPVSMVGWVEHSTKDRTLVLAIGQRQLDAILLTNFE